MNRSLLVAGVLAVFTAAVHVFVGTSEIAQPLLRSALAPEVSFLLYACWHLVSCALVLSALALVVAVPKLAHLAQPKGHDAPSINTTIDDDEARRKFNDMLKIPAPE